MFAAVCALMTLGSLADLPKFELRKPKADWLISAPKEGAKLYRSDHPQELVLSNGLIARRFRLAPNAATVGLINLMTGEDLLRAIKPEARLTLRKGTDKPTVVDIGGLTGQPNLAYLTPEWIDRMTASKDSFKLVGWKQGPTTPRMAWKLSGVLPTLSGRRRAWRSTSPTPPTHGPGWRLASTTSFTTASRYSRSG